MAKSEYIKQLAERKQAERRRMEILRHIVGDAYTLAAHDVLGMGPGRAKAFQDAAEARLTEIFATIHADSKDDRELAYAFAKIDEALGKIVGQDYEPCEIRYYR